MSANFSDHGIYVPTGAIGEVDVLCPQCSSHRKKKSERCLSVNVDGGTWLCHHCGWSGSLGRIDFWKSKSTAKPKKEYRIPTYTKPETLPKEVIVWFAKRGISPSTLHKEGIGYDGGWIKFPYHRGGNVINIKSRKLTEKEFFQEKGAEKILYGMADEHLPVPAGTPLIWVEGEMDRLALLEAGYTHVVSVPDGAPAPGAKGTGCKFDYLENCEDFINKYSEHVLATDNDAPGQFLRDELARRLGLERCKRMVWPVGCKDANDTLIKHGISGVQDAMRSARFFPVEGVFEVNDILPDAFRLYDEGVSRGVSTGWPAVDKFLTIRPGELCILTGIPSSGKSSWLDALVTNLAVNEDWRVGVFSPENAPLAQHFKKLAECYIGKSFLQTQHERMTPDEVVTAAEFLQEHFYFISPNENPMTLDQILEKAKVLVFRHGINFLIIDPYNDIDHGQFGGGNETDYISRFLSKCQRFARKHNVFLCLVAHPTKLRKDERTGEYPVPTPYDIAGSAHFRNRGDICLAGHRPDLTKDIFELHIQKVRFKEVGSPGMVRLDYSQSSGRFYDNIALFNQKAKERAKARGAAKDDVDREMAAALKAHEEYECECD